MLVAGHLGLDVGWQLAMSAALLTVDSRRVLARRRPPATGLTLAPS